MEGVFYMQSSTFGRLCITQRINLRGTYTCPKKWVHYSRLDDLLVGILLVLNANLRVRHRRTKPDAA